MGIWKPANQVAGMQEAIGLFGVDVVDPTSLCARLVPDTHAYLGVLLLKNANKPMPSWSDGCRRISTGFNRPRIGRQVDPQTEAYNPERPTKHSRNIEDGAHGLVGNLALPFWCSHAAIQ